MKYFLKLSSLFTVVLWISCSSPYKHLTHTESSKSVLIYKPKFNKVLYRCIVNGSILFKKYHLSGLLLLKTMDNGTIRAVFQNEMGATFFDMEWSSNEEVKVNSIIKQLDKPAVIAVLKKDLSMLLMMQLQNKDEVFYNSDRGKELYSCFSNNKGAICYVQNDAGLSRIEDLGNKKKVTTVLINAKNKQSAMPDSVFFDHHSANFTIQLTKISADVNE